MVKITWL